MQTPPVQPGHGAVQGGLPVTGLSGQQELPWACEGAEGHLALAKNQQQFLQGRMAYPVV